MTMNGIFEPARRRAGRLAAGARLSRVPDPTDPCCAVRSPGRELGRHDQSAQEHAGRTGGVLFSLDHADCRAPAGQPTAPRSCCWNCPIAAASNACCCRAAHGGRSASARRWAVRWDACSVPAGCRVSQRNLTACEIVEQMARLQRLLPGEERFSHIVVMGMGEPLANLDQLLPALDFARRDDTFGIGTRRITISTVGLPGRHAPPGATCAPLPSGRLPARAERHAAQPAGAGERQDRPAPACCRRPTSTSRCRAAG